MDADSGEFHIVFDIDIDINSSNIIEDSLWILDDNNYGKWQTKMLNPLSEVTFTGINIKGDDITAVETIKAGSAYLTSTQLTNLQSEVVGWLDVNYFGNVGDALQYGDDTQVTELIACFDSIWQPQS